MPQEFLSSNSELIFWVFPLVTFSRISRMMNSDGVVAIKDER